jgi:hypothetical protein
VLYLPIRLIIVSKNLDKTIKVVVHVQTLWETGLAPQIQTVRTSAYRLAREMKWEFQIISMMKLKVQDVTAEILSFAGASGMNRNTVGTFCKLLDKLATENNPLTHMGIFPTPMKVAYK